MPDAAKRGAKLFVKEFIEKLNLKEFFLVICTTGNAFRRCELAWINGDQIGARFIAKEAAKGNRGKPASGAIDRDAQG